MTQNKDDNPCSYCEGAEMREKLAQALESGRYREQPAWARHPQMELRNQDDRYSITGVAADVLMPCLWVRNQGSWHVFDFEHLPEKWHRRNLPHETTSMNEEDFQEILETGAGESIICPEQAACTLGLHTNHEHPNILEIRCPLLSDDQKKEARIPLEQTGLYPLNMLDFRAAARLLRDEPNILEGDCTCSQD